VKEGVNHVTTVFTMPLVPLGSVAIRPRATHLTQWYLCTDIWNILGIYGNIWLRCELIKDLVITAFIYIWYYIKYRFLFLSFLFLREKIRDFFKLFQKSREGQKTLRVHIDLDKSNPKSRDIYNLEQNSPFVVTLF